MGSRANVESYATKNNTSFNAAKRALGYKHDKGSVHRAAPVEALMPSRGPIAGTGKPRGGEKT